MSPRMRFAVMVSMSLAALTAAGVVQASTDAAQSVVVSATPQKKTPNILDGEVNAIAQVGNRMVVGGTFTQVKSVANGVTYNRSEILSFDPTTGAVDPNFAPVIAGGEVDSISAAPGGNAVFVSGMFSTVNGTAQKRLVKINLSDGSVDTAFKPAVNGTWVQDTQVLGNDLYIAGAFTQLGKSNIARLGAVNVDTGAADPNVNVPFTVKRDGTLRVAHFDISPDGTKLIATGTFTQVGGQDRAQIAMLNLTTTPVSVSNWETDRFKPACSPRFDTYIRDVKFSPDGSYFVVGDTGAYSGGPGAGSICDSVSRWETDATGTGMQPTWIDYTGGDSITQVATTGTAIYAGGHQRWMNNPNASDALGAGGVGRMGIAALDPVNGMPFSWNPGRNPRGSGVWAMLATDAGLWVGSDTDYINGVYHAKLALMPAAGGATIPTWNTGATPGTQDMLGGSGVVARSFDGSTFGAASRQHHLGDRLVAGARRVHDQRPAVHGLEQRSAAEARLRRHHVRRGLGGEPERSDLGELPGQLADRHVLRRFERTPVLLGERFEHPLLPLLRARGRRRRRAHLQPAGCPSGRRSDFDDDGRRQRLLRHRGQPALQGRLRERLDDRSCYADLRRRPRQPGLERPSAVHGRVLGRNGGPGRHAEAVVGAIPPPPLALPGGK